jgi:hypothetical protein
LMFFPNSWMDGLQEKFQGRRQNWEAFWIRLLTRF